MKLGSILIPGALLAGLFFYFKSAKKVTNLSLSLGGLKLNSSKTNISQSTFDANLSAYNPNTQDVKFTSFIGNVFTEDGKTRLANIDTAATVPVLKARATTNIPVQFVINNTTALQEIIPTVAVWLGLSSDNSKATLPQAFVLNGTLKAENLPGIPISQKIKLSV